MNLRGTEVTFLRARRARTGLRVSVIVCALSILVMAGCAAPPARPPAAPPPAPPAVPEVPAVKPAASRMSAQDIKDIAAYHNKVRADVGVGPLQWSPALANYAQEWADHLASTNCGMEHRTEGLYGENLFQATAGAYTAVDGAKAWESEKKDYHGGALTRSNWQPSGHYTQMVWRDTRMLGCGEAVCNTMLIVACNYDPPGNVLGRKPF
jgi:pathogenesis-related protein 1